MAEAEKAAGNPIQIVLVLCVAILAIVGVGWVLLDAGPGSSSESSGSVTAPTETADPSVQAESAGEASEEGDAPDVADVTSEATDESRSAPVTPDSADSSIIESTLRKARMAAEADVLVEPEQQSAVFFYSQVLGSDPDNAVANAELDAVLGRLAIQASSLLEAEDYDAAYALSQKVASVRPDHELVSNVQQVLNSVSGELVASALERAEADDESAALALIDEAEALPGQNTEYLQAVREAVGDLLQARQEAQEQAAEERRQDAARATASWMASVREAIDEGRLVSPTGDNALSLMKQRDDDGEITRQLRSEWLTALLAAAASAANEDDFESAEALIAVAEAEVEDSEEVARQKQQLEDAIIDRESSRVIPVSELTALNRPPAAYPRRAEERGISGWVDVEFTVDTDGVTKDVRVTGADPESVFDESAVEAVSVWTFEPREFRGRAIEQSASARLIFRFE